MDFYYRRLRGGTVHTELRTMCLEVKLHQMRFIFRPIWVGGENIPNAIRYILASVSATP